MKRADFLKFLGLSPVMGAVIAADTFVRVADTKEKIPGSYREFFHARIPWFEGWLTETYPGVEQELNTLLDFPILNEYHGFPPDRPKPDFLDVAYSFSRTSIILIGYRAACSMSEGLYRSHGKWENTGVYPQTSECMSDNSGGSED